MVSGGTLSCCEANDRCGELGRRLGVVRKIVAVGVYYKTQQVEDSYTRMHARANL